MNSKFDKILFCSVCAAMSLSFSACTSPVEAPEEDVRAESISVYPESLTLKIGDTVSLEAVVLPLNSSDSIVAWVSDAPEIVSVEQNGRVTAVAAGEANVIASVNGGALSDGCVVTVEESVEKFPHGIQTVRISAGTFLMGSPESEPYRYEGRETQHEVTLTKDFYMSIYEITNSQFVEFLNDMEIAEDGMGTVTYVSGGQTLTESQSFLRKSSVDNDWGMAYDREEGKWVPVEGYDNYPAMHVTWYGATAYADWVGGSLPTEAQWEYACRAGSTTTYPWGRDEAQLVDYAWYIDNSDGHTHPVGELAPNAWGLYDMLGNVWEWCSDWYADFTEDPVTDPVGPETGETRSLRGSAYYHYESFTRPAMRYDHAPWRDFDLVGFRVVFNEEQ